MWTTIISIFYEYETLNPLNVFNKNCLPLGIFSKVKLMILEVSGIDSLFV